MKVDRPDEETVEDPLPEGTESVVWAASDGFRLTNCSEYDESIFPMTSTSRRLKDDVGTKRTRRLSMNQATRFPFRLHGISGLTGTIGWPRSTLTIVG